jgi:signal transduction histidine kinase
MGIWLAAYKMAAFLEFFKPYSSLWFLPAGVTLAITLSAPGYLKLAPFAANLLLAVPLFSKALAIAGAGDFAQVLHAARHFTVYGGAALVLITVCKVSVPALSLRDAQWIVVVGVAAAIASAVTGVSLHAALGNIDWSDAKSIVVQWAIGDAIGAIVVPPLLVPLLRKGLSQSLVGWQWPSPLSWFFQVLLVGGVLAVGPTASQLNPALGSLWYLTLIPPIVMAVRGGMPAAATSVFLTSILTPLAAFLVPYHGEMLALSLLLLIGSVAGLIIGGAISDRRRAYVEVATDRAQLEQTVENRTQELSAAYNFQRHLIRSIGHDLRQPLQTINLMLDGLAVQAKDGETANAILHTRQIGATASAFLTSVLNYARLDPGKLTPNMTEFPVQSVFTALQQVYGPVAEIKGVVLRAQASSATLVSDEQLVAQALSNYLDNSLRLSERGMVVTLSHTRSGERQLLLVQDEIESGGTQVSGIAGFGHDIVGRIAELLDAEMVSRNNEMGLAFKARPASRTPK